ncbi:SUKH-4 family immunity protein [Micromonospora sp. WMMD712]|uniref:SUKH-4 family immunity protein n=1 Tax=Micromonospora sp. WMMD712 TaxID=3016096 RepID=UPI00249BEBCE|nr:SUKH-4 family immunity protein [Micromonospora sp. WMMD712]WFE56255.1 SUKH-4 family immunity protein [Micromonospora sp. WMMD712]
MPNTDAAIDVALARLRSLGEQLPYPGDWLPAARVDSAGVVLAEDEGLSRLVVDPATGAVSLVDDDGSEPVNSTLAAFVACAEAYLAARAEAHALPDDADDDLEAVGERLTDRFRQLDPASVGHENRFWSVAAEELGYGMT